MDSLAEPRWPPALAVMKKVDDLLRCGICFEYFNIAMMIPQCSHNYCSLCIRKFLSYKTQCPTCCVTVTEPDLKNNRVLDELVKNLNFARNHLLQFALESPPISAASSSSKNLATKADTAVAFRHSLKQGSKLMENFLIRESGGSASELLIKENESKLSPQKKLSSPAKTRGTPSAVKSAPGSSEDSVLETPSTSALKQVTKAAEIVQEIENMEKTRMRFEASKLNESVMVFTKNQTEKEIDEIHSKYRKKHQDEFHLLVDQAKKGYKKTVGMSKRKATKGDESTEKLSSVCVGQEDNKIKSSDTPSVETNHFRQSKLDFPGKLERSRQDDSFSCTDIQEEALSSSESDSFKSSSSDIIRDLLEEEEAWEASHKNDFQDREISPGQNRRTRSAESAELEPRNKRNRN
ncbi:E3 ubiquitin-protein ligase RAD18 isoform X5 [Bos indicus]|uniref:E3 ubiquitin-protein ligase RAD18 isoform X5 n=1 Tax=Bos indicus TaxID=9915 RepID=A0A6P5DU85_BOSIN|nr:E3 ubiquitin-protein ligase RAD18 isoform X5 [Bos taurus]XP_027378713.1 E3 ubiquitin-protein ligase RAD18 isoform X6 [Bos indicus x Bos taurus]